MLYSENIKITKGGIKFTDKHGNNLPISRAFNKAFNRFANWWLDFKLYLVHLVSATVPFHGIRHFVFRLSGVKIGDGTTIHMGMSSTPFGRHVV